MNEINKSVEDNQQNTSKNVQPVRQNVGNGQYKKDVNRKPFVNNQQQNNQQQNAQPQNNNQQQNNQQQKNQPQQKTANSEDLNITHNNQRKELYPPRREPRRDFTRHDNVKIKVEETQEDIIRDCLRIEKEIDLEIKEITTMRLGL